MLETVRDYAIERSFSLGLADEAGSSDGSAVDLVPESMLVEHALRLAAGERAVWEPGDSTRSYGRLRAEIPNVRAAREVLAGRGDTDALISISVGLLSFTEEACLAEVWGWIDELASVPLPDDPVARSEALAIAAAGARNRGELDEAMRIAREVIELDADDWPVGRAEHALAMAFLFSGDPASAAEHWLVMDERIGTLRGHNYAALCAAYQGDVDRAWDLLGDVAAKLGGAPVQVEIAYYFISGEVAKIAADPAARELLERAVALATEHECWFTAGVTQVTLVSLLVEDGDVVAAAESYIELIDRWLRAATWPQLWTTLRNVADIPGEFDDETRLAILAAADHDAQAPVLDDDATALQDGLIDECRDRLGDERADAVVSSVRRMPRGEIAQRAIVALRALIESENQGYGP
jgi:tetratricopeptide (TPR) repeat protein